MNVSVDCVDSGNLQCEIEMCGICVLMVCGTVS